MKFSKFLLSISSMALLITGCGNTHTVVSVNPFKAEDEITKEEAMSKVEEWQTNLDTTSTYDAHYYYEKREHIPAGDIHLWYEADYRSTYSSSNGYQFTYKEGTIAPGSSIDDTSEDFGRYPNIGNEFIYFTKAFEVDDSAYHYYLKDNKLSYFMEGRSGDSYGYQVVTINQNGFITYHKDYEYSYSDGYYGSYVHLATYTKVS